MPLSTLGLLQYLAPIFQFGLGVVYFKESMPPERWAGFALVWLALSLLTWDALRTARRNRALAVKLLATAAAACDGDPDTRRRGDPARRRGDPAQRCGAARRHDDPGARRRDDDRNRNPEPSPTKDYLVAFLTRLRFSGSVRTPGERDRGGSMDADRGAGTATSTDVTDVLVVGAGPTGLVLACDLARRGIAVRIVDRSPAPPRTSRAKGPNPRSLEILDDLGVAKAVLAAGSAPLPMLKYRDRAPVAQADPW